MHHDPLRLCVRTLLRDLDTLGWDGPVRLYAVQGKDYNPYLRLITAAHLHPVDLIATAPQLPRRALGAVVTAEAWGWEPSEDQTANLIANLRAEGIPPDVMDEAVMQFVRASLGVIPPGRRPDRYEQRDAYVLLRSGRWMLMTAKRGGDPAERYGDDWTAPEIETALSLYVER